MEGRAKVLTRAPTGPGRLFGMGRVDVEIYDSVGGSVALRFSAPVIVLHGGLPVLLGHGLMEQYALAAPLGALVPTIDPSRIDPRAGGGPPEIVAESVNRALRECAWQAIQLFKAVAGHCVDPSDAVAILPLGTYVSFLFRSSCERAWSASEALSSTPGLGVAELGAAMRSAMDDAGVVRTGGLPAPGPRTSAP